MILLERGCGRVGGEFTSAPGKAGFPRGTPRGMGVWGGSGLGLLRWGVLGQAATPWAPGHAVLTSRDPGLCP